MSIICDHTQVVHKKKTAAIFRIKNPTPFSDLHLPAAKREKSFFLESRNLFCMTLPLLPVSPFELALCEVEFLPAAFAISLAKCQSGRWATALPGEEKNRNQDFFWYVNLARVSEANPNFEQAFLLTILSKIWVNFFRRPEISQILTKNLQEGNPGGQQQRRALAATQGKARQGNRPNQPSNLRSLKNFADESSGKERERETVR